MSIAALGAQALTLEATRLVAKQIKIQQARSTCIINASREQESRERGAPAVSQLLLTCRRKLHESFPLFFCFVSL